ncbi:B3 domain-containing protein At2g33720-like [Neltuma alba]|uniref:B3 domain-containing protein At2g33720-like n=1 Tax=Neltuma alba TaxID=207710 RepID=UPI0010A30273|nr:B3 domain-containing protein At2g33720-like [Prosopis alba]
MERNHPHHRQQPHGGFFNVFSENHISKGLQESSSSSSSPAPPNFTVSTELSLSSSFSSSVASSKTRTRGTHQYFSKRNSNNRERKASYPPYNYFFTKKEERHHESNISQSSYGRCSTALRLYDDPWKIKKVLTTSDLGKLNRLMLTSENSMEDLVVSLMGSNNNNNSKSEELLIRGRPVRVWDLETKSMHQLVLKQWASIKNYVLIGNWNQDFVKRRNLKKGDEIGLQWDPYNFCFNFSVLKRLSVMAE